MEQSLNERKTPLWLLSFVVTLPTFFAFLATSATNVALPHIAGSFGSTNDEAKWVVTSYMVANGIFLPLTGWLERKLARLNFLKIFILIFTLGSVICAIAPNLLTLILGRVVQGIGGGVLMPLSQSILLQEFPKDRKGDAMAIFIFAIMVSSIMGPTVGGLLVDNFSWQWIFIINIPVGIISLIAIPFLVPDTEKDNKKEKVDYIGLMFLIFWLFTMQVVLDKGQQYGWFDCDWICWLSWFSLTSMFFFIVWELEIKNPIVNLRVFKDMNFFVGTILGTLVNALVCVTVILIPQFFQGIMHYTASQTGLSLSSRVISVIPLLFIGKLCKMFDVRLIIAVGLGLIGASITLCTNLNLESAPNAIVLSNILFGFGSVFAIVPVTAIALGTLSKEKIANAAGVHSLTKCVAGSVFTSLASSFAISFSQVHQSHLLKNMTVYNPAFNAHFSALKTALMHYNPACIAANKANALLYKQLIVQTKLYALVDLFQIAALVTFIAIPLVILFKVNSTPPAKQK
ncbi:MAG: DHA2 family efflux MFS transporter permease subunit [Candidatus Gastranaerophilales bacterium]|nr:DHA2 family efflux MFS transporter permease subunit [Candidatus Gastranaerophilales bacterium]